MIVAIAGLPAAHYNAIQRQSAAIFGTGQRFLAEPLKPDPQGAYAPGTSHATALLERLTKALKNEPALRKQGCGVIYLRPDGFDIEQGLALLKPFAAVRTMALPAAIETHGRPAEIQANQIADELRVITPSLVRAVNAMNTELETRRNRTPLLLPLRNFDGRNVANIIKQLSIDLPLEAQPHQAIAAACRTIEARYPFGKVEGGKTRCFTDDRNVQYRSPGRANHGMAVTTDPPHNVRCYLNGGLRIGGYYLEGFHYDCRRDHSDGKRKQPPPLKGMFTDCHDSAPEDYTGDPHLNIAPNDFVRA